MTAPMPSAFDENLIALIATDKPVIIDQSAILQRIKVMFPQFVVGDPIKQKDSPTLLIPVGDVLIAILEFSFPIPPETLAGPLSQAWHWREAGSAFERSKAHVLVSVIAGSSDTRNKTRHALTLTCATAALSDLFSGLGIYWSTGDFVYEPKSFIEEARAATIEHIPFDLWVSTKLFPGPNFAQDSKIFARSSGLEAFLGREVECGPYAMEPNDLFRAVRMIGWYALAQNIQFADGSTVGSPEQPFGRIHLRRSATGVDNKAVFALELLGGIPQ